MSKIKISVFERACPHAAAGLSSAGSSLGGSKCGTVFLLPFTHWPTELNESFKDSSSSSPLRPLKVKKV
jgi:hypothetical protein